MTSATANRVTQPAPPALAGGRPNGRGNDPLYLYFALAYIAQGISSQFGLIAQPTQFFLKNAMGLSAADVSMIAALMMLPWVLKPVYGLLSDTVPLFGYRRKSYLLAGYLLAIVGLLCVSATGTPMLVIGGLVSTALAMAIATALMLGLAAQSGKETGDAARYMSAQSFYYYLGNIGAVLAAGFLCHHWQPAEALHYSALVALIPVIILVYLTVRMIRDQKCVASKSAAAEGWQGIRDAIRQPQLWIVGIFAACWNFTPSLGVPLYFHQSGNLFFDQALIGQLSAWNALGMMLGAVVYRDLFKLLSSRQRLCAVIALWSLSILSYVFLSTPASGYFIEVFRGCANTIEILCLYELAAALCTATNAVSIMAFVLAARNLANEMGTIVGGNLFTHVFHNQYLPLILVGLVTPLLSFALVPYAVPKGLGERTPDQG